MKTTMIILMMAASALLTSCEHSETCTTVYNYQITGDTYKQVNCQINDGVMTCDSAYIVAEQYTSESIITFEMTGTASDFEDVEGTVIYEVNEGDYQVTVTAETSCR